MFLILGGVSSCLFVAVFAQHTAAQWHVLLDNTPSVLLRMEEIAPDHAGEGPSPRTRVTIYFGSFVHTFVLIGFEVHLLTGTGHVEFKVVLHHERGMIVVAV